MRSHLDRWGLIALVALAMSWTSVQPNTGRAQSEPSLANDSQPAGAVIDGVPEGAQLAGPSQPGYTKRSGSPALEVPATKRSVPPIRRPRKPRPRDPEKDGPPGPPGSVVVYRPSTGEMRFEPRPSLSDVTKKRKSAASPSSVGLLGTWPSKQTVIGVDERQRIDDTTEYPWRITAKLYIDFPKPSYWVATGALIGDFHVLTAGHAVYNRDEGGWITQMEFLPGLDGNYAPFSSAWDVEVRIPTEYYDTEDPDYDWALVTLDRNIGAILGYFGYDPESLPLSWYPGKVLNLAGYPGDKEDGLAMYWSFNQATEATERVLWHLIDSSAGQSGGPIFGLFPGDEYLAVAVHTYGFNPDDIRKENSGSLLNVNMGIDLNDWRGQDPRPIDYPELIDDGVEFADFSPGTVQTGTQFEVHSDVRNIGTTDTAGFLVSYYASADPVITQLDYFIGSCFVSNLQPFSYVTCRWEGAFPASIPGGVYYVGWIIDSGNNVDEISEDNNTEYLDTQLIVGGSPANIRLLFGDVNTNAGSLQVSPGTPLLLSALLQNTGESPTGPFWLEFWGSRSGGLMTNLFLANSAGVSSIGPGQSNSFAAWIPLSSIPDGPYTVVMIADRPNQVVETDKTDNRFVVGGKRIVVLRPQTDADMTIQGFSFGPNPVSTGQPIALNGQVTNVGTQASGSFWIEFWGSFNRLYPTMDFFVCDSIGITDLAPGQSINLAAYPRTLYNVPAGVYMVGVFVDRIDQVSERDETNNYIFLDGQGFNMSVGPQAAAPEKDISKTQLPDLVVTWADFSPFAPYQALPGTPLNVSSRIENLSATPSGPVWVEYWGSRTGGLTLDEFIADSSAIGGLGPWGVLDLNLTLPLYSIPDGPYSVVVVVDRPRQQTELFEGNNRRAVAGKRLLTIRPQTQANAVVEYFGIWEKTLHPGQPLLLNGRVRNTGTQNTGPFWVEFFGTFTPDVPYTDYFLCDSIPVADLAPGQWIELSTYTRLMYSQVPAGVTAPICFADRTDLVNETHEEDNYTVLQGFTIAP